MLTTKITILRFLFTTISIATVVLVTYSSAAILIHHPQLVGSFGQTDFREYWSAAKLLFSQINPYNAQEMFKIQSSIGYTTPPPLMMWTPPWTLIVMFPILLFPFQLSALLWVLLCLGFILSIAYIGNVLTGNSKRPSPLYYLLCLTFFPSIHCLLLGQISLLLALAITILLISIKSKRFLLCGFSIFLLTIKPHLFLLVVIALLIWCIQNKTIKPFLWGIFFILAFSGLSELLSFGILKNWALSLTTPTQDPLLISVDKWETRNLCYVINSILNYFGLTGGNLTQVLVPIAAIIGTTTYLITKHKEISIERLSLITALSVLCSPFGWVFDNCILLPFYCFYLSSAINSTALWPRKVTLVAILLAPQLVSLFLTTSAGNAFGINHPISLIVIFSLFPAYSLVSFYLINRSESTSQINL